MSGAWARGRGQQDDGSRPQQRRLLGQRPGPYDLTECPPGHDPWTWKLACIWRDLSERADVSCPSRRSVCAVLEERIRYSDLRAHSEPWAGKDGEPGWYRLVREMVLDWFRAGPGTIWLFCEREQFTALRGIATRLAVAGKLGEQPMRTLERTRVTGEERAANAATRRSRHGRAEE